MDGGEATKGGLMDWIENFTGEHAFLSNFYMKPFWSEGYTFESVEHYFNANKTLNSRQFEHVLAAPTPSEAKRRGRKVTLRPQWDQRWRYSIMMTGLQIKFRDEELRDLLESTGDALLVEGNTWHDNVWGVCRCDRCGGKGRNMLGIFLMLVRDA